MAYAGKESDFTTSKEMSVMHRTLFIIFAISYLTWFGFMVYIAIARP
ncbi:MAG: hypothetical protein R3C03_14355 [Pirellulaceae bacterium]